MKCKIKTVQYLAVAIIIAISAILTSCSGDNAHFLKDKKYRDMVHEQFLKRKELAKGRSNELFAVFDKKDLTTPQREALEFLYAYMPLSDLADYDGDFFLSQVNGAFAARDTFKWGKTIPEDIFRHFVLVYRVNNESLDSARNVFFGELKDRIKNMSMYDAALEVNHWCHEKVMYKPSDGRTSAPLASMRTSWGRCGEESTFTVTAMRAVGIPARQCYTPRWAHTDDNHAWVEVWIDGKWHYLGACEPEPELDVAWFTAPAKRAMMVHTNVFGIYNGPEEKNVSTPLYSRINLLANYAETKKIQVTVTDEANKPVEGATVKFKVYNYAELYPISTSATDAKGNASIITGLGDLVVWANSGDKYGFAKVAAKADMVSIQLNRKEGGDYDQQEELIPPAEKSIKEISADKQKENARRLAYEDSLRNSYMATFKTKEYATELAGKLKLNADEVWYYLQNSQGNFAEIESFITKYKQEPYLFPFLATLSEKDLRDSRSEVLADHLDNGLKTLTKTSGSDKKFIADYILSPHISLELIRPWRSFLQSKFDSSFKKQAGENVQVIADWIKQNITIDKDGNYYGSPMSPRGVYELKVADSKSCDILFVAICRSLGIPARIEQATGKPQYYSKNQWHDVILSNEVAPSSVAVTEKITLSNSPSNIVKPEYYSHYTIAKFKDGDFVTLDFENDASLKNLPCVLNLDTGYYRLMMGTRANDGSVTVKSICFTLEKGKPLSMTLALPELKGKMQVLGIVDMNMTITLPGDQVKSLKELAMGKGLILCIADPAKEPTRHVLNDIPLLKQDFESWKGGILFMVPDDKVTAGFDPTVYKNLPQQTIWGTDNQRKLLKTVTDALRLDFQNNFPLTMFITADGKILYYTEGYLIGIGENLLKSIHVQTQTCSVK